MRGALAFIAGVLAVSAAGVLAQPVLAPRPVAPVLIKPPIAVKAVPMPIAPLAMNYTYTAVPQSGAPRQQGSFSAGSTWTCTQTSCTMSSPAALPAVGGCNALAQHIGPIGSYGRNGAALSPAELDQCNRGIPGAVRMAADAPGPTPASSEPAPAGTASAPTPAPAPASLPAARFTIVSSELSAVGGLQGTIDPRPGRVTLASGELAVAGGAQSARPRPATPMSIAVPELSVVGH